MLRKQQSRRWFDFGSTALLGFVTFIILSCWQHHLHASPAIILFEGVQLTWFQGVVLGFVQGLTEFIPISSTAHMKVVPVMLGWGDPGVAMAAIIQLGSVVAVLGYFWQDLRQVFGGAWQAWQMKDFEKQEWLLFWGICLGTVPILVAGVVIKVFVPDYDESPLRSLTAIAVASIVMSVLLAIAEKSQNHDRQFNQLTLKDGLFMGVAQALAIIPGVSRSGSTMTTGLFMNLDRATAARFSFLLGIPAITIAGLVELKDLLSNDLGSISLLTLAASLMSSVVFSYLAIAWLIKFLQNHKTWIFVWYRLAFGMIILALTQFS
ncbi:undecaprenyl-diphosphate phosphatase [[Limnothrix rosea] IAM M-220]|uniref:undecaprenyl-diphosphate phosphatase n=1 Tax=[Limnothrix rosea] IAM M-220 TaxID=454133 RepID=UPI000961468D|nr:undecaprenyl-diphosphate phosphatase [[Limnothrix rosea] IAM M-220]OKH19981.1 undecaprenyl-diphosphatase [[Limnothrix rosea] IAM M-220]